MAQILRTTCDQSCVEAHWVPVIADDDAEAIGNWAFTETDDGARQWTYLGRPVWTFRNDRVPGDTLGEKFGSGANIRGGWAAILRETLAQKLF